MRRNPMRHHSLPCPQCSGTRCECFSTSSHLRRLLAQLNDINIYCGRMLTRVSSPTQVINPHKGCCMGSATHNPVAVSDLLRLFLLRALPSICWLCISIWRAAAFAIGPAIANSHRAGPLHRGLPGFSYDSHQAASRCESPACVRCRTLQ